MSEASAAQRWQQTALEAAFAWLSRHAQHPATCDRIIGNGACTCGLEALHDMLCQGVAKAQPTSHPSKPIAFPDKALFEDRFWSHVDKSQPDACWLWRGSVASNGYGRLTVRQVDYGVHRLAYCLANGPIPPGLLVCHSCDNRLCVNPTHLWLGDVVANNRDMEAKGRARGNKRTDGRVIQKLTAEQARDVYRRAHAGETYDSIAVRYGICRNTVGMIKRRELWSHAL